MSSTFAYLIRFHDQDGNTVYGNLSEPKTLEELIGSSVPVLSGDPFTGFRATEQEKTVTKVLCPLKSTPIFQCVGVNYQAHADESEFKLPSHPVVFPKTADSIAGPFDELYIPPDARTELDYEGELCFVFATDCKDVTEKDALDVVLGYMVGNDVTARNYIPFEVSGRQMGYGKSFDAFAPIGPYLVSPEAVRDPYKLRLITKVNGEVRQDANTSDLIWSIEKVIAHLTRGRTVRAGTVCMMGTPGGVGWFMDPPGFVREGDEMEVSIEKLGAIKNRVKF